MVSNFANGAGKIHNDGSFRVPKGNIIRFPIMTRRKHANNIRGNLAFNENSEFSINLNIYANDKAKPMKIKPYANLRSGASKNQKMRLMSIINWIVASRKSFLNSITRNVKTENKLTVTNNLL